MQLLSIYIALFHWHDSMLSMLRVILGMYNVIAMYSESKNVI